MLITRRTLLASLPALAAAPACAMQVGSLLVEPVLDGLFPLTLDLIPGAGNEDGQKLLTMAGLARRRAGAHPGQRLPDPPGHRHYAGGRRRRHDVRTQPGQAARHPPIRRQ